MTYGVYTQDLKGCSLSGNHTIDECKEWCYKGKVICSEKDRKCGFTLSVLWHEWNRIKLSLFWQRFELGWLTFTWSVNRYKCADKVVWRPEDKEAK